ncbi:hypothetical protein Q8791_27125 [Nocardiopsis sp. CT-R113]|uniref:Uncharacterized protein n=1 Tax=Nocardiopsis codii TaxID=3065942 RepID=A0ABU7KFB0_9ACTN|nr:hypothetical protein [Nocardiopsis sp. CT-R113]MEE2040898.1 hypothetical protein [Nocardiopsis sp. CT-R113]
MVMFRNSSDKKAQLKGGQPFVLYWQKEGGTDYYPLAQWEGKDMVFKEEVSREDVVQFKFDISQQTDVTSASVRNQPLLYRVGNGQWSRLGQRKGHAYYLAGGHLDNAIRGVRELVDRSHSGLISFSLRMDVVNKADVWISQREHTGSIRVSESEHDRANLVAVRHGDAFDDALGQTSVFSKHTRDLAVSD